MGPTEGSLGNQKQVVFKVLFEGSDDMYLLILLDLGK